MSNDLMIHLLHAAAYDLDTKLVDCVRRDGSTHVIFRTSRGTATFVLEDPPLDKEWVSKQLADFHNCVNEQASAIKS